MTLYCTWSALKTLKTTYSLNFQHYEDSNKYKVIAIQNDTVWFTEIWINSAQVSGIDEESNSSNLTDFENNFKDSSINLS